jgi:hypothetical protein
MLVQIEILREAEQVKEQLEQLEVAGWRILEEQGDRLTFRHDKITDEADARQRLYHLGILTSALLRIRFQKSKRGSSRRQLVKA